MSRSGYTDDCDGTELAMWRGAVRSAIRGARGQLLLRDMLAALDAMPVKRLIKGALVTADGECCGLGAVALARKLDVSGVSPDDRDDVAAVFDIAPALAAEIAYVNDDDVFYLRGEQTPEERFLHVRTWVESQIRPVP
jgi:hypothetical protein